MKIQIIRQRIQPEFGSVTRKHMADALRRLAAQLENPEWEDPLGERMDDPITNIFEIEGNVGSRDGIVTLRHRFE
jgi:hypothetical protein